MPLTERGETVIGVLTARGRTVIGRLTGEGRLVIGAAIAPPPIPPAPPPPFMGGPSRETIGRPQPYLPTRVYETGRARLALSLARSTIQTRTHASGSAQIRIAMTGAARVRMVATETIRLRVRLGGRDRFVASDNADELWLLGLEDL
jgi:hypothetical protein